MKLSELMAKYGGPAYIIRDGYAYGPDSVVIYYNEDVDKTDGNIEMHPIAPMTDYPVSGDDQAPCYMSDKIDDDGYCYRIAF